MRKAMVMILALAMAGTALLAIPTNVSAQAEVPVWDIGDGWYFGNTADFDDMQQEIDQGLEELPPGFDASMEVGGGIGAYFGVEVVADDVVVNGYDCYQVDLTGALAIDFGMDASVDGTMNEEMMHIEIDADGNAVIVVEANLDGSLYFTVDQLAFVKGDVTITADGYADIVVDAYVDMQMDMSEWGGGSESMTADINADISLDIDQVSFTGSIECDPPISIFDFPIYEYDTWWVPEEETTITTNWNAQGTIDMSADITGIPDEPDVHEHETVNLAVEIGSGSESLTINHWDGVQLECVAVYGNNYIIEVGTGQFIDYVDWGTRQYGIDYMDMLPVDEVMPENAGVQYNADSGFIDGMTMDGEVMTTTTNKAQVDSFSADPLSNIESHGSVGEGGALGILLIVGIIVIVVVFVVVLVVVTRRKKTPLDQMYGAQQPYQQPPPQPPQEQYQQPPPPPQQQQPPPPPPPSGQ